MHKEINYNRCFEYFNYLYKHYLKRRGEIKFDKRCGIVNKDTFDYRFLWSDIELECQPDWSYLNLRVMQQYRYATKSSILN